METRNNPAPFSISSLSANAVFQVGVEISKPNNLKYHQIEDKELEDIMNDSSVSIEKSCCVASIGYILGQAEKIYHFFTTPMIEGVDIFLLFIIGAATATAITTGIIWWKKKSKLDKLLESIRARPTIILTNK